MRIFALATLVIALRSGTVLSAAGTEVPPKELVQYIVEATRVGLKEPMIVQNAVAVGWPVTVIDNAIAYVKNAPAAPDSASSGTTPVPPPPPVSLSAAARQTAAAAPDRSTEPVIAKNRGVPDDYQIGAGDVLQISVWKEPDASVPTVVVRPDGKISMPLLKDVEVMGMTPRQAEGVITDGLARLIHGADVTVIVTAITSKKVYVVGAAKKEGPLPYTYRMTVMQAISEAGGLTDYAKRKKIYVLHTDNGKEYRLPFNYDQVIKGEKTEQNIQLSPGDTLFIPH